MMDGFINILKPTGMTSHDVVSIVRRLLHQKKVGHTGTLDPNAAGVLPICIGRATKFSDFVLKDKKRYYAKVNLGLQTDTLDSYGMVTDRRKVVPFQKEQLLQAIQKFIGEISQIPPKYSAIKVNGKRLYELARLGQELSEIEIKERNIFIHSINLLECDVDSFSLDIICSSGTYIRSLAVDIAAEIGNIGYLSLLIRTESGNFYIQDSITLEELEGQTESLDQNNIIIPIENILLYYPEYTLDDLLSKIYLNGGTVFFNNFDLTTGIYRIYSKEDMLLGIGTIFESNSKKYLKNIKFV